MNARLGETARESSWKSQARLGTTRNVVVTPAPYYGNNQVTVDAVARLGPNARGIVLPPDVADAELKGLTDAGVRGMRYQIGNPAIPTPSTVNSMEAMSRRVGAFGWHLQVYMRAEQIVAAADILNRVTAPIVFDHLASIPPVGMTHEAFAIVRRLIDKGRTWVKLSGAYLNLRVGRRAGHGPYA